MPTPGEKRALTFLAAVAALGVAVRGWQSQHTREPVAVAGDASALARQIDAVDSAISAGGVRRGRGRGKSASGPTGVLGARGRAATRTAPAVADAALDPQPPDARARYFALREREDAAQRALSRQPAPLPDQRRSAANRGLAPGFSPAAPGVDLDVANEAEIAALPAIGGALARRIVRERIEFGPFGSLEGLQRVQGVSAGLARRISPHVTFSRSPFNSGSARPAVHARRPAARKVSS